MFIFYIFNYITTFVAFLQTAGSTCVLNDE